VTLFVRGGVVGKVPVVVEWMCLSNYKSTSILYQSGTQVEYFDEEVGHVWQGLVL